MMSYGRANRNERMETDRGRSGYGDRARHSRLDTRSRSRDRSGVSGRRNSPPPRRSITEAFFEYRDRTRRNDRPSRSPIRHREDDLAFMPNRYSPPSPVRRRRYEKANPDLIDRERQFSPQGLYSPERSRQFSPPRRSRQYSPPIRHQFSSLKSRPENPQFSHEDEYEYNQDHYIEPKLNSGHQWEDAQSNHTSIICLSSDEEYGAPDKRIKLSGAAKKRRNFLVNQGMPFQEACEKALHPINTAWDEGHEVPDKMIKLSGAGRKRRDFFLKQGMSLQEASVKALQPINTTDKANRLALKRRNFFLKQGMSFAKACEKASQPINTTSDKRHKVPNKMIQLSGAARKRRNRFLYQGMSFKEATAQALKPINKAPTKKNIGKKTSNISTPKDEELKRVRKENQSLVGVKVGILHPNHPEELLQVDQLKATQEEILRLIVEKGKEATTTPKFLQVQLRHGWLDLTCADEDTADWLKNLQDELRPWEGASLKVADQADMSSTKVLVGYIPGSQEDSNSRILSLIEAQNGLNTSGWRILTRNLVGGPQLKIELSVDATSAEKLRIRSYLLSYKFGQVQLRPKVLAKKVKAQVGAEAASTSRQDVPVETQEEKEAASTLKQGVPVKTEEEAEAASTSKQDVAVETQEETEAASTLKQDVPVKTEEEAETASTSKQDVPVVADSQSSVE